jgi:hypothetical protein
MLPLPAEPYVHADWRKATVGTYHVRLEDHHDSVPHALSRQQSRARLKVTTLEVFRGVKRVGCHRRATLAVYTASRCIA